MSSLVTTLTEIRRYRGAIGQWSWVLHRLTGLGVVLFLILHVVDTSWAVFFPGLYEEAIAAYQSPLFTIGEFALVFAVVYHAYNGLRIAIFDYNPQWWKHQQNAAWVVLGLTVLTLVPTFLLMFSHVVKHYEHDPFVLDLGHVLLAQLPFIAGMVVAVIAAIVLSGLVGLVRGGDKTGATNVPAKASGSRVERFWWAYMRTSGLLIVPLVFGHLALMHVIQGVFDLTTVNATVAGVPLGELSNGAAYLGDGINATGTATEYVLERWGFMAGPLYLWRIYDLVLLALVTLHGFNGLRYVLTDYLTSPFAKRAAAYTATIGGLVLLGVGGASLIVSIDETMVDMALESACELRVDASSDPLFLDTDGQRVFELCAPFTAEGEASSVGSETASN